MKIKSIAAILAAGIMVVSVPMVALADTPVHTHDGVDATGHDTLSVDIIGGVVVKNDVCKTTGDITNSYGDYGVMASDNAVVEAGNVKAYLTGLQARSGAIVKVESAQSTGNKNWGCGVDSAGDGAKVYVTKEVYAETGNGIYAPGDTYIEVGSVKAKRIGVIAGGGATVVVKGAVESTGEQSDSRGIDATAGAVVSAGSVKAAKQGVLADGSGTTVTVTGEVKTTGGSYAINAYNGATVTAGSVSGSTAAVNAASGAKVIVKEDVNTTEFAYDPDYAVGAAGDGTIVLVNGNINSTGHGAFVVDDATMIVLGTITAGSGCGVLMGDTGDLLTYKIEGGDEGIYQNIDDNISYIIKGLDSSKIKSFTGTTEMDYTDEIGDGNTYKFNTAKRNQIITVSVATGYELKAGEIEVTLNEDGTYSVTIPLGGGVTLEAIRKAIQQASGASFTSIPTSMGSASAPLTGGTWSNVDGRWTYTNNGVKFVNTTAWIQYTNAQGQTVVGKFCFDNYGYMITGWKQTADGVWNYFGADGAMVVNTTTPDGYVVDAEGKWIQA